MRAPLLLSKLQQQQQREQCQGQQRELASKLSSPVGRDDELDAMASRQVVLLATVVLAVACLASPASAMQWKVGDDGGWRAAFDQTGWTDGKMFMVGDTLLFTYPKENHTVAQVGKDAFAACDVSTNSQIKFWDSGSDVVHLDKPGKVWFICTKPNHCLKGMKMVINVMDGMGPGPAPEAPPPSSAPVSYTVAGVVAAAGATLAAAVLAF